jgi:hypothetical protein
MNEGVGVAGLVLQRLAERELEVNPVVVGHIGARELPAHRLDVRRVEAEGLQVGEAPPRLAVTGCQPDGVAVGRDAVTGASRRLEYITVGDPDARIGWVIREHRVESLDGTIVFAQARKHVGPQVQPRRVLLPGGQQQFELGQRLLVAVDLVEGERPGVPCRGEVRCARQAGLEQRNGVLGAPDPDRDLGEQPQRRGIPGMLRQGGPQQPFRFGQAPGAQGGHWFAKPRTTDLRHEVIGPGRVGTARIAGRHAVIRDQSPRLADRRLNR